MSNRLNIAISPELKALTSKLYKNLGMSLSTAIKVFCKQSLADGGMPFRPNLNLKPTKDTREVMNYVKTDTNKNIQRRANDFAKDDLGKKYRLIKNTK